MHDQDDTPEGTSLVSNRALEIVVALLLLAGSAVVILDSVRLGIGWREGEGPAAGYFPFYIAVILGVASFAILVNALLNNDAGLSESFVSRTSFGRVITVLIPAIAYVFLMQFVGIYAASTAFILFFMIAIGGERVMRSIIVAVAVPLFFFFMFEKWFLVPLPKGPIEAFLGY